LRSEILTLIVALSHPDCRAIVRENVSRRAVGRGWDPLLRIAASVKTGWVSATYVIDRFGFASQSDPATAAGEALGKLLRTLYLCDSPSSLSDLRAGCTGPDQIVTSIRALLRLFPMSNSAHPTADRLSVCLRRSTNGCRKEPRPVSSWK